MNPLSRIFPATLAVLALSATVGLAPAQHPLRLLPHRPIRGRGTSSSRTARCSSTSRRSTSGRTTRSTSARRSRSSPTGAKEETFGVIFATARTQVDKVARTVVFENLKITKTDFPTLPNHGAAYTAELQTKLATQHQDRRSTGSKRRSRSPAIKPPAVAVQNNPPQVIVSYSPAILVPIDGAPVLKPVPGSSRVPARHQHAGADPARRIRQQLSTCTSTTAGCRASTIAGPWAQASWARSMANEMNAIAQTLVEAGTVDLLDGGPKANPKPSLANGVPTIYTSQTPTELIVFKGQPDFVPIVGTQLLWASNTTSDVLIDTANNNYYVLMSGRWFRGARR